MVEDYSAILLVLETLLLWLTAMKAAEIKTFKNILALGERTGTLIL